MIKQTELKQQVVDRLSSINDLVWLQEFALYELESEGRRLSPKAGDLLTTDVFGGNPFAKRINIHLNELEAFRMRLSATLLDFAFVQSYELIGEYLLEAESLLRVTGKGGGALFEPEKRQSTGSRIHGWPPDFR